MAKMTDEYRRDTRLVRAGLERSQFQETSEAMFLNSGYVYDSAEEAAAAFAGEADRFVYSRYGNPTVSMLQTRLAALEGAEACLATGTGMAGVFAALACQLDKGDRVVASRAVRRLLCDPERHPALLGRYDRIRRWHRPRPVARGAGELG